MEIQVVSRHPQVTEQVRAYAEKKIARLERYLPIARAAQIELSLEKTRSAADRALVQVTLSCNGAVLRAQDRSADFLTSIDAVSGALRRQIDRYKARVYRSSQRPPKSARGPQPSLAPAEEPPSQVVRSKRFPMKPMTAEDAVHEMELLGHDFFLFMNSETRQHNVVYRRSAGGYGLIEPEAL